VAVFSSILDAIGHTPLVRLSRIGRELPVELYGKVEACNPGGSAKDRLALHLCDMAEKRGFLRPGGTIVEASAGNTGVGLSMVAAVRGYHSIVVVPHQRATRPRSRLFVEISTTQDVLLHGTSTWYSATLTSL